MREDMHTAPSHASERLPLIAASILPFVVLALVLVLGVNVPFADEWDWTPFLYHAQSGTLTIAELWRQHNEHRMFFASMIVLFLAKFGGWNLIREEIASIVICALSQVVLWRLVLRTLPAASVAIAFLAMSLELWNVGQAENFAMGLQVGWFLMELCVLIVVWRLTAERRDWRDLVIAGIAATIASYCSEIGLLAWPVGLCAMLLARGSRGVPVALWVVWGVAAYALFRIGLVDVRFGHASIADHVGAVVLYSFAYLGVPIAFWSGLAGCVVAGAALVALFAGFIVTDLRSAGDGRHDRAAWYSLGVFAILGAIGTAPNRLGFGVESVVTSVRYILIGSWLTIAVVALASMRFPIRIDLRSFRMTPAGAFILVVMVATSLSWLRGFRDWQHFSAARWADVRALRDGDMNQLAPYYVVRPNLMSDVEELRRLRRGPLGPGASHPSRMRSGAARTMPVSSRTSASCAGRLHGNRRIAQNEGSRE